jgi:hypothetical protein
MNLSDALSFYFLLEILIALAVVLFDPGLYSVPYVGAAGGAVITALGLAMLGMGLGPAAVLSLVVYGLALVPLNLAWRAWLREPVQRFLRGG